MIPGNTEKTLREHLSDAGKARQAKLTKEEKTAHAKMMNARRWPKKESTGAPVTKNTEEPT